MLSKALLPRLWNILVEEAEKRHRKVHSITICPDFPVSGLIVSTPHHSEKISHVWIEDDRYDKIEQLIRSNILLFCPEPEDIYGLDWNPSVAS